MKRKIQIIAAIVVILIVLISSTLIIYYLENQSSGPALTYDFSAGSGSFLGWKTSGKVYNESDDVAIGAGGTLWREFKALDSEVRVSVNWSLNAWMVINRQLNGVTQDLPPYMYNSSQDYLWVSNSTSFEADKNSTFTVTFEPYIDSITYLNSVELWHCAVLT